MSDLPTIDDSTAQLFLDWMTGAFVGTKEAMLLAVKQAMTKALAGEKCPYA